MIRIIYRRPASYFRQDYKVALEFFQFHGRHTRYRLSMIQAEVCSQLSTGFTTNIPHRASEIALPKHFKTLLSTEKIGHGEWEKTLE